MTYNIGEHIHKYSVWTAARAQRSFTNNLNVKKAIDSSGLKLFAESKKKYDEKSFEQFHKKCANRIINNFKKLGVTCSYGRAAKIIAIYLKTSVAVGSHGKNRNCSIIHPPIDSILLKNLGSYLKTKEFETKKWTKLNKIEYWTLIERIKSKVQPINWSLEKYWILK